MQLNCAPVCQSCKQLHVETGCPLDSNAVEALQPGELDLLFERVDHDPVYQKYEPVVLSRPTEAAGDIPGNTYNIRDRLVDHCI